MGGFCFPDKTLANFAALQVTGRVQKVLTVSEGLIPKDTLFPLSCRNSRLLRTSFSLQNKQFDQIVCDNVVYSLQHPIASGGN